MYRVMLHNDTFNRQACRHRPPQYAARKGEYVLSCLQHAIGMQAGVCCQGVDEGCGWLDSGRCCECHASTLSSALHEPHLQLPIRKLLPSALLSLPHWLSASVFHHNSCLHLQEAHLNGMACVIECAQEDAEKYCEGLRGNGLMASVEPAGGGGDSKPSD